MEDKLYNAACCLLIFSVITINEGIYQGLFYFVLYLVCLAKNLEVHSLHVRYKIQDLWASLSVNKHTTLRQQIYMYLIVLRSTTGAWGQNPLTC